MQFGLSPALILVALAVPVAVLVVRRPRSGIALPALNGLHNVASTPRQRLARWLPLCRAMAIALLAIAIAQPRVGRADAVVPAEGVDITLALDISSSMESNRVGEATRLEVARQVVRGFIAGRENDRIGLVVFQRDALALAPPSLDYDALDSIVADLRSGLLPDGTGIGVGIAESLNMLRDSAAASRVVVLLTDGEQNATSISPRDAAELAAALRIRVYTIGVTGPARAGTRPDIDVELLTAVAERTGGRYFTAVTKSDLAAVYDEIGRLETSRVGREHYERFTELGPWFALSAAVLAFGELLLRATWLRRLTA